ncbi:CD82 antigen isoform X2 [Betta splendens]|uniref:CD82 antigen isoform X2 n=1 Tax=Betta splendens TaxID=158456 RepID=A0A6P7KUA4_BETSP|nr:CD82 antigen isoform X2 [Betta splendens]
MKLELEIQLLKFCCAVFNSLFLVLGLCVVGCAVWILFDQGSFLHLLSSAELRTAALVLLLIGAVVTVVSVAGCVGADREQRFLLLTYLGFLLILALGQAFVTLVLLLNKNKIKQSLDEAVDQAVHGFGGRHRADVLMDNMQHYSLNLTRPDVLPCSCFGTVGPGFSSAWCSELLNFTEPLFGSGNGLFDQGCEQKLSRWLQDSGATVLALDAGLIVIQAIQFVVTVLLYRAFGTKARPLNAPVNTDHVNGSGAGAGPAGGGPTVTAANMTSDPF